MCMATRTDTQSPALHGADSHDLIRVHGARVNNLKDISVVIPKRRLTVFTGVSRPGAGKARGGVPRPAPAARALPEPAAPGRALVLVAAAPAAARRRTHHRNSPPFPAGGPETPVN